MFRVRTVLNRVILSLSVCLSIHWRSWHFQKFIRRNNLCSMLISVRSLLRRCCLSLSTVACASLKTPTIRSVIRQGRETKWLAKKGCLEQTVEKRNSRRKRLEEGRRILLSRSRCSFRVRVPLRATLCEFSRLLFKNQNPKNKKRKEQQTLKTYTTPH